MIPSPAELTYFIAVAELLNVSRAAERLGISQPSLTAAIHKLEHTVGTPLFTRHQRGVTLTKAGKQLYTHSRLLLRQWDAIRAETLASIHEIQGEYTLGCHSSIARYSLPSILPNLMEQYPKLGIRLQHGHSRKISEQVIQLSVDIGIVVNPIKHPDLVIKTLSKDKVSLWVGRGKRSIQSLESGHAVLICDPDLMQTQDILKKMKKQGITIERLLPTSDLEVVADLTEAGCGIGVIPGNIAASRKITMIPKSPSFDDEICLLYHGQHRDVQALKVIAEAIKQAFLLMSKG